MTPAAIAAGLRATIDEGLKLFADVDERHTVRPASGAWSAREVIGHLIDSACNNHRRFIVGRSADVAAFDGYNQDDWVSRQHYNEVPWRELVALWTSYNRHLAHVIGRTPPAALAHAAAAPDGRGSVTLGFIMEDYVRHLRHHLDQLRSRLAS